MSSLENEEVAQSGGSSSETMQSKLKRLGFVPTDPGMRLQIGQVQMDTAEGPFGLVIFFTSVTMRTMTQYQVTAPYSCGSDQIVKLIFLNISANFKHSLRDFTAHFENLGPPS
jgi:hypothetical protein